MGSGHRAKIIEVQSEFFNVSVTGLFVRWLIVRQRGPVVTTRLLDSIQRENWYSLET